MPSLRRGNVESSSPNCNPLVHVILTPTKGGFLQGHRVPLGLMKLSPEEGDVSVSWAMCQPFTCASPILTTPSPGGMTAL